MQSADALADKLTELLEQLEPEEAEFWMDEISAVAEERGWISSSSQLRRPAWIFATDLFVDNPSASDLISLRTEFMTPLCDVEEICWFCDFL